MKKPKIILSLLSMKNHLSRVLQMMIALTLSLTCITMTFSLTSSLQKQIYDYIYSYIPTSSISFRLKSHDSIALDSLQSFDAQDYVLHSHLFLTDYELIAMGKVSDRYNSSEAIEIGDDSGYVSESQIELGRMMTNDYEIVISRETAYEYLQSNDISSLINQDVNLWYKHLNYVRGVKVKIVGITNKTDSSISIYHINSASIAHINDIYNDGTPKAHYGVMSVKSAKKNIESLEKEYPLYEFKIVGESTINSIDEVLNKIELVLFGFSLLAIISCVFLFGEVMFLEVNEKRKDIAIMKCFGANVLDIVLFIFNQSLIIYVICCLLSFVSFYLFKNMINHYFITTTITKVSFVYIDYKLFVLIYLSGFVLLFISQLLPLIYAISINQADALKSR